MDYSRQHLIQTLQLHTQVVMIESWRITDEKHVILSLTSLS